MGGGRGQMVSLTVYNAYFKNCSNDFHQNFNDPTKKLQDRLGGGGGVSSRNKVPGTQQGEEKDWMQPERDACAKRLDAARERCLRNDQDTPLGTTN